MKKLIFLLFCCVCLSLVWAQDAIPVKNHVFIIDVSGSMEDVLEGNKTRLDMVKDVIKQYAEQIEEGDYISVYPYHGVVAADIKIQIKSQQDKKAFYDFVSSLKSGGHTCTYTTLADVLTKLDPKQMNIIQLYTDGEDSGKQKCGSTTLSEALGKYQATRGEYDFLFYIAAYDNADPLIEKLVNSNPNAQFISGNSKSIPRMVIIMPQIIHMTYDLDQLSVNQGFYVIGKEYLPKDFKVVLDEPTLNIKGLTGNNEHPFFSQGKSLNPNEWQAMELSFANPIDKLTEGTYKGTFKFVRKPREDVHAYVIPNEISITFKNQKKSTVSWGIKRVK